MQLRKLFGTEQSKRKKRIQQLKDQQEQLEQQDSHDVDDVVQYYSNLLMLDFYSDNQQDQQDRFNMYSGSYLPLTTAGTIKASRSIVSRAYKIVAKQNQHLYQQGIEAADREEKRSPIKQHPFKFDTEQLGQYRKEQYGKHAVMPV